MAISVKIVRIPGSVSELMLDDGATVNDAMSAAGTSVNSGERLEVDGREASGGTTLYDGARIVISKAAKGA